ncbi:hypothetical protein R6Z07M_013951 [Ovis aries]
MGGAGEDPGGDSTQKEMPSLGEIKKTSQRAHASCNKRSHAHPTPCSLQLEKDLHSHEDPVHPKLNNILLKERGIQRIAFPRLFPMAEFWPEECDRICAWRSTPVKGPEKEEKLRRAVEQVLKCDVTQSWLLRAIPLPLADCLLSPLC